MDIDHHFICFSHIVVMIGCSYDYVSRRLFTVAVLFHLTNFKKLITNIKKMICGVTDLTLR